MYLCLRSDIDQMIYEARPHVNANQFSIDAYRVGRRGDKPYDMDNFKKGRFLAWMVFVQKEAAAYFHRCPHAHYAQIRLILIRGPWETEADVLQSFRHSFPSLLTTDRLLGNAQHLIEELQYRRCVKIASSVATLTEAILTHKDFVAKVRQTRDLAQDDEA